MYSVKEIGEPIVKLPPLQPVTAPKQLRDVIGVRKPTIGWF